jgi:hypothetical protein
MDWRTLREIPPWEWPKDTAGRLLATLRDERAGAEDLLIAVELAGDITVTDDEIAKGLLSILANDDQREDVRRAAAIALGPALEHCDLMGFDDPDDIVLTERMFRTVKDKLHELFQNNALSDGVRRAVLEASVRAAQDWHRDAVRKAYASTDETWRVTAVFCMGFIRGFDAQILEALKSSNKHLHYEAVRAAGAAEVDGAWSHIVKLATSKTTEKPVRIEAILALAGIRPDETPEVLDEIGSVKDPELTEAIEEARALSGGEAWDGSDAPDPSKLN